MDTALTVLAANFYRVDLPAGGRIWFSYSTPVAIYLPTLGGFRTDAKLTATTTRHLSSDPNTAKVPRVPAEQFAELLGRIDRRPWSGE